MKTKHNFWKIAQSLHVVFKIKIQRQNILRGEVQIIVVRGERKRPEISTSNFNLQK